MQNLESMVFTNECKADIKSNVLLELSSYQSQKIKSLNDLFCIVLLLLFLKYNATIKIKKKLNSEKKCGSVY